MKISKDENLDELEMGIIVKDFETYIDNLPNPLFVKSMTSQPVKLDQYGVSIKPKIRGCKHAHHKSHAPRAKSWDSEIGKKAGERLMAKGAEYQKKAELQRRLK